MADKWSSKDRRMFDHIKKSARENGASADRAEELAARSVNKHRREQGRTPNKTSQGTGNPHSALEQRTVRELRNRARELRIDGRSNMDKAELVRAIRQRQNR